MTPVPVPQEEHAVSAEIGDPARRIVVEGIQKQSGALPHFQEQFGHTQDGDPDDVRLDYQHQLGHEASGPSKISGQLVCNTEPDLTGLQPESCKKKLMKSQEVSVLNNNGTGELVSGITDPDHYIKVMNKDLKKVTFFNLCSPDHTLVCASCTKPCKMLIKSHIYPRASLKSYQKVHFDELGRRYIYELHTGSKINADELKAFLFCEKCEKYASVEEQKLNNIYLQLMGTELTETERLTIDLVNFSMLKHILGTLLFRGILVAINFKEIEEQSYYRSFCKTFNDLREYCNNKKNYSDLSISKRIHIFFLPNNTFRSLNTYPNIDPTGCLDLQLRTPEFTNIFNWEGKTYLYAKFDIFHILLPVDETDNIDLQHCHIPAVEEDGSCYYFPNHEEAVHLFPKLLVDYNLSQVPLLLNRLLRVPSGEFLIVMDQITWDPAPKRTIKPCEHTGRVDKVVLNLEKLPDVAIPLVGELDLVPIRLNLDKPERKKLIKRASSVSPLISNTEP